MAFNLIPVLKFLGQSGSIASTVTSLVKEFQKVKNTNLNHEEIKKALEVQSAINEKIERQVELLQLSILNLQKTLKVLAYIVIAAVAIILISLSIIIFG
jgi:predicted ATPase with chaperone activity